MLETKHYVISVIFGLVAGFVAFLILQGNAKPVGTTLLESAVVALVGVGGYLYGQYNRARQEQKQSKAKMSKKQMKRARKR